MNFRVLVNTFLTWQLVCGAAAAQGSVQMRPAKRGLLPNLERVLVPLTTSVALSETAGLLAFTRDRTYPDAHVSLVKLDAKGVPEASARPLKLPRPAGLMKFSDYALALTFHPKLPLLYVWQEIALPYTLPLPADAPKLPQFDRLHIYSVAKDTPELLVSLCRGSDYLFGCLGGALHVDKGGDYLYIPNVRDPNHAGYFKVGRFALDETGMPRLEDKDGQLPPPARLKRLVESNAKALSPHQASMIEHVYLMPFNNVGCGFGFHAASKDAVIVGTWSGVATWAPDDKRATLSGLTLRGTNGYKCLGAHPHLPVVYVTAPSTGNLYRVTHGEGYVTQLPQQYVFTENILFGPPAVLTKSKKLAVGSRDRIYLLDLDEQGRCGAEPTEVQVNSPVATSLVYSERYDRLYVGVGSSK